VSRGCVFIILIILLQNLTLIETHISTFGSFLFYTNINLCPCVLHCGRSGNFITFNICSFFFLLQASGLSPCISLVSDFKMRLLSVS
jgi:hypothetical protein